MLPATAQEAKKLFDATKKAANTLKNVDVVVVPPSIFLRDISVSYRGKKVAFGLQDVHWEKMGAYTGSISLMQGLDAHASYALVGHSERRAAGETNDETRKKVAAALAAKVTPILCVGEKTRSSNGEHFDFIKEELQAGFKDVDASRISKVIVAYEPIWAIGKETTMSPREMHEMTIFIHKVIAGMHGNGALSIKILYGGAVTEANAVPMVTEGNVYGLLVGHVSTEAKRFGELLAAVNKI